MSDGDRYRDPSDRDRAGMSDEDLLARLRRTLHERAGALDPAPGYPPVVGTGMAPADASIGEEPEGATAVRFETGPVPLIRPGRRRRPVAIGAVAAMVAAVVVAAAALSGGAHHHVAVRAAPTGRSGSPSATVAPTGPDAGRVPGHLLPSPPTTAPAPPTDPVPAGFRAMSVTFVSANDGWVLGSAPCQGSASGTGQCPAMAATTDGGRTWRRIPAPPVEAPAAGGIGAGSLEVRFADRLDGWVYSTAGSGTTDANGSGLWSTHDGGSTWNAVADPAGPGDTIADLEASDGQAQLVVLAGRPPYPGGRAGPAEAVYTTPASSDSWRLDPVQPALGAGPVTTAQLVLWGADGWLTTTDRVVVSGARLLGAAGWGDWSPPCLSANGAGLVAASSSTALVAVCSEGMWGPAQAGTSGGPWLFSSSDGGTTFVPVGSVPGSGVASVSTAPGDPEVIVVADGAGLVRSGDGGRSWTTGYGGESGGPGFVGFTTTEQAVAVVPGGTGLVVSRDGGISWTPVDFQAGP